MVEAPTIDLWIGLHNSKGGSFYWTVGKPVRYTNWGTVVSGHILWNTSYVLHYYREQYLVFFNCFSWKCDSIIAEPPWKLQTLSPPSSFCDALPRPLYVWWLWGKKKRKNVQSICLALEPSHIIFLWQFCVQYFVNIH